MYTFFINEKDIFERRGAFEYVDLKIQIVALPVARLICPRMPAAGTGASRGCLKTPKSPSLQRRSPEHII
jgi:hypothetical protein